MAKPHWFPFYVPDFLSSPTVTMMSAEEVGGYVLLLCYAWQDPQGSLPTDDDSLRVLSRLKGDLTRLKSCFVEKKGRLYNKRLTQELDKVKEKSVAARHSAAMRWHSEGNANALRRQCSSQSESQSQSESELQSERQSKKEKDLKTCAEVQKPSTPPKSAAVFESYREAYRSRYGVDPVRNQQTNSMLCKVVDKLGSGEATHVARFYLTHNDPFYVRNRHPVNMLLQHAEGLRTQWATNTKATTSEARNAEMKDSVIEQAKRVEAILQGRRA